MLIIFNTFITTKDYNNFGVHLAKWPSHFLADK